VTFPTDRPKYLPIEHLLHPSPPTISTMAGTSIVLITGGNTGIGYETVKALYASPQPHTILMGSRSLSKATAAISTLETEVPTSQSSVVPIQLDIEDDASMQRALADIESKYARIDALVNNAGPSLTPHMPQDKAKCG
jgi:NAD(P)-dependent dehydrogenase (short-subunit alcohol dehydrogenase family)